MDSNANVTGRIKMLLQHYSLNANSVTHRMGYSTTSKMYKILQGAEPSFPTLVDFLTEFPDISSDWLILGEGPMLRGAATTRLDAPQQLQPATGHPQVLTAAIDNTRKENTLLVPLTTQARYAACCNEAIYLQELKRYYLPGFEGGAYRAFEVEGGSMSPTFGSSDIVVCSLVDRWDLLKPRECYVVVTTENLLLKRINVVITDQSSTFELHSDNPGYEPYRLPVADLKELWLVRGYLSRIVPARPVNLEASTERLQELVDRLGRDFQDAGQALDKRGR